MLDAEVARPAAVRLTDLIERAAPHMSPDLAAVLRAFGAELVENWAYKAPAAHIRAVVDALPLAGLDATHHTARGDAVRDLWQAASDYLDGVRWAENDPASSRRYFERVGDEAHRERAVEAQDA